MTDVFVFASVEPDDPLRFEDVKPVLACRCCLVTEHPLRPLDNDLRALYYQLVGFTLCQSDIYPSFLCHFCRALLIKFAAFRKKCLLTQTKYYEIHSAGRQITQDIIQLNIKYHPHPQLKITNFPLISIENDNNYGCDTQLTRSCMDTQIIGIDETENKSCKSKTHKSLNEIQFLGSNCVEVQRQFDKDKTEVLPLDIDIGNTLIDSKTDKEISGNNMLDNLNNDEYDTTDNLPLNNFVSKNIKNRTNTVDNEIIKTHNKVKDERKSKLNKNQSKTSRKKIKQNENKITKNNMKSISINKKVSKGHKINAEKIYNARVVLLSKEEQINQIQSRKESLNYKRSKYKCVQCFRGFITELTYKNHMVRHEPNQGEYICDVCFMRYESPKKLNEHCNNQHRYNFICNYCGVITKSNCNAKLHYDWHNGVKYDCKICGKSFDKPTSVTGHMHLSHGGSVTCTICNETFIGAKGLSTHMIKSHKDAIGAVCSSCGVQFHSTNALRQHRLQGDPCDHTHRPCAVCGEGFQTEDLLRQHKLDAHKSGFTCEQCGKSFDSMLKYRCHFAVHNETGGPMITPVGRGRGGARGRRARGDRHPGDGGSNHKPVFMCEICGSNLTTKTSLEIHIRTHTGEKPFQCDHCDRRYNAKSILHLHMSKHLNLPAKEFACSFCGKLFNLPQNRDRHENGVHRKLRRFKCDICEKMYSEKVNLQAHIKTKHLGMPWPKRVRPPRRRGGGLKNVS